ncbi:hypothetical protein V7968_32855 [Nocardia vulneris]|uniref:hypothetical protein n=1 Tax=Nocardia vulneris TaxID=1141657 RepID=UPI0030D3041E
MTIDNRQRPLIRVPGQITTIVPSPTSQQTDSPATTVSPDATNTPDSTSIPSEPITVASPPTSAKAPVEPATGMRRPAKTSWLPGPCPDGYHWSWGNADCYLDYDYRVENVQLVASNIQHQPDQVVIGGPCRVETVVNECKVEAGHKVESQDTLSAAISGKATVGLSVSKIGTEVKAEIEAKSTKSVTDSVTTTASCWWKGGVPIDGFPVPYDTAAIALYDKWEYDVVKYDTRKEVVVGRWHATRWEPRSAPECFPPGKKR